MPSCLGAFSSSTGMRRGPYSCNDTRGAEAARKNIAATAQSILGKNLVGGNRMQGSREMLPPEGQSSPRKRRRSPDEVANAKVQKFGNGNDFDDDDLDTICSAALEDYEQTQRERSGSPNTPGDAAVNLKPPPIPVAHPISTSTKVPNAAENPYLAHAKVSTLSQPVASRFGAAKISSRVVTASLGSAGSDKMEEERIKLLQEQNYAKDGEVKLLRSEKERMMGEIRKQEERMRKMQATLQAEKQSMEKKLMKERDALATQLRFKDQELQEKCILLEQRSQEALLSQLPRTSPGTIPNRSQPQKTTPSSSSSSSRTPVLTRARAQASKKGVSGAHDGKRTEFLSSETFMPLSQLSSSGVAGVTPVSGGPHRWDASTGNRGRGQTKAAARSRSISPSPSDLKKMKKRSVSDKGGGSSPQGRLEFSEKGGRKRTSTLPADVGDVIEDVTSLESAGEPLLPAPERELDGAQILLLLVNQNLLKPPVFQGSLQTEQRSTVTQEGGGGAGTSCNLSSQLSGKEDDKIRGLLSLLHIETKPSMPSFAPIVGGYATPPTDRRDESVYLQRQSSDSEQSCGSTPTRRPHLLPHPKAHTLGRTNLAKSRIRHSSGLLNSTKRSHSAANTPFKAHLSAAPDSASISLLSSIDPDSLNKNIGNLLVSSEVNRFDSFSNRSKGSLLSSVVKARSNEGPDPVTEILKQIGQVITSYHREQLNKTKSSSYSSEFSESTGDSFLFSPKSSTTGSRTGSDLASPLAADQLLVIRALEILEVLVTYSRNVREQIMLQPPEFIIESRPSSSLGIHQNSPLNISLEGKGERGETCVTSRLAEVSHRLATSQQHAGETSETKAPVATWKDARLSNLTCLPGSLSDKVWVEREEGSAADQSGASIDTQPASLLKGSGCGLLFSVLMELPVPPWKECLENTLSCFKILTTLAGGCPVESLHRFGQLLQKETLLICLEKEEPPLTSAVLSLLTLLVRSDDVVGMLCRAGESCTLTPCYQCLLDPPSSASREVACNIQLQVVRLVSQIAASAGGPLALYQKCDCSHELLGHLVLFLEGMVEGIHQISQWSHRQLHLVREVISLVLRISISDHYFDTHRDECEHVYTFVFNRLRILMKPPTQPEDIQTAREGDDVLSMVTELLGYCEDSEDSSDSS